MADRDIDKMVRDSRVARGLPPEQTLEEKARYDYEAQKAQFDETKSRGIGSSLTLDKLNAANKFLIDSARVGNLDGVNAALAAGANPNFIEVEDGTRHNQIDGATPLMYACWAGPDAIDSVKKLLSAGAEVNIKTPEGNSAIMFAAQGCAKYNNHLKDGKPLIGTLVAAGANPSDGFRNGKNTLFICVNEYDGVISTSAMKALIEHGANPNSVADYGSYKTDILSTAVWTAQQSGDNEVEAVKVLVEAGANVNPEVKKLYVDSISSTPLGAAVHGRADLVQYLIDKGANPLVETNKGETIIGFAKERLAECNRNGWNAEGRQAIVDVIEAALQKPDLSKAKEGGEPERASPTPDTKIAKG